MRRTGDAGPAQGLWRLAGTALALLVLFVSFDRASALFLARDPDWRSGSDPRLRLFSEAPYDGSRVVLIGDSVFYSEFVDTLEQTLWRRLEARLGARVFPAALIGASPQDVRAIARRVARFWPRGTVALVGIFPFRLFGPKAPELPDADRVLTRRLTRLDDASASASREVVTRVDRWLSSGWERGAFLSRNRESVLWYLESRLRQEQRHVARVSHDGVWDRDTGLALARWRGLQALLADGGRQRQVSFSWVEEVAAILSSAGIRPVFVLTPLNFAMVRRLATPAFPVERIVTESHAYLLDRLRASRFDTIDLFDRFESSWFADVAHPNVAGNDRMAAEIAAWLAAPEREGAAPR